MKIRKKFLQLTRFTYPYGTEQFLEWALPMGAKMDPHGNYYLSVGSNYTTMFTCHLDTSCSRMQKVKHKFYKNYIMSDGSTILGADDKAGMVVLLYMIENKIPGLYYFFIGEEVGCIGSSDLASDMEKGIYHIDELKNINKVVSFDRRGTNSVITDQFYGVCCSNDFAKSLCEELNKNGKLNMYPDDTGVLTDSAQFMGIIPECTNISVGYYDEHTHFEMQDINHLYNLCHSVIKVDWETLPINRSPNYSYELEPWEREIYEDVRENSPLVRESEYSKDLYSFQKVNGDRKKIFISRTWINHETILIHKLLTKMGHRIVDLKWDGTSCWCQDEDSKVNQYIGNRSDLSEFIPDFCIPSNHIKYDLSN